MRSLRLLPLLLLLAACSDPLSDPPEFALDVGADASRVDAAGEDTLPTDVRSDSASDAGFDVPGSDADESLDSERDVVDWPPGSAPVCPQVVPVSPPASLGLDPFYTRSLDSGGIPIVGSDEVPPEAFARAHFVVANMLRDRPCIRAAIVDSGIRIAIMSRDQVTTDIPEYSDFYDAFPGVDWNTRGRGFGATLVRPATSCSVDNLLQDRDDPWFGENILLHELAHSYWEFGIRDLAGGAALEHRLDATYAAAVEAGLWDETYAQTNPAEYWAEGVQSWFSDNSSAEPANGIHNWVDTREELEEYDPALADLIAEFFSDEWWPAYCAPDGPEWIDPTPAMTPGDCSFDMRTLRDQGCDRLAAGASSEPVDASELVFVNRSYDRTLTLSWVDYAGELVEYGTLGPRTLLFQGTFEGHPWLVRAGGECLGYFVPASPRARVIFE